MSWSPDNGAGMCFPIASIHRYSKLNTATQAARAGRRGFGRSRDVATLHNPLVLKPVHLARYSPAFLASRLSITMDATAPETRTPRITAKETPMGMGLWWDNSIFTPTNPSTNTKLVRKYLNLSKEPAKAK